MIDRYLKQVPLCVFLLNMRNGRVCLLCLFMMGVVGFFMLNALSVMFSQSSRMRALAVFHLRPETYAEWFLEQVTPRMYSFDNRAEILFHEEVIWDSRVNHYPTRILTFERSAQTHYKEQYRLISRYQGIELSSRFHFVASSDEPLKYILTVR